MVILKTSLSNVWLVISIVWKVFTIDSTKIFYPKINLLYSSYAATNEYATAEVYDTEAWFVRVNNRVAVIGVKSTSNR